jgi:hypothetical protein
MVLVGPKALPAMFRVWGATDELESLVAQEPELWAGPAAGTPREHRVAQPTAARAVKQAVGGHQILRMSALR